MKSSYVSLFSTPLLLLLILISVAFACNLPNQTSDIQDEGAAPTAAAKTIESQRLQNTLQVQQVILTSQAETLQAPDATSIPTVEPYSPAPPTETIPVPTFTPVPTYTPTVPTATFTPNIPTIIASIDTNCRTGPSKLYPAVGYLLAGKQSTVHGRNDSNTWWYIANPGKPGQFCWVWAETTTVSGNTANLPVITPPPLPTLVDFSASFSNMHICGGVAFLVFRIDNIGTDSFWSSSITIRDLSQDIIISGPEISNTPFLSSPGGCPPGAKELKGGNIAYVGKGLGLTLATGTRTRGIIILCTEPNLAGTCIERKVNFDFP